jgi:hypothetical protein
MKGPPVRVGSWGDSDAIPRKRPVAANEVDTLLGALVAEAIADGGLDRAA